VPIYIPRHWPESGSFWANPDPYKLHYSQTQRILIISGISLKGGGSGASKLNCCGGKNNSSIVPLRQSNRQLKRVSINTVQMRELSVNTYTQLSALIANVSPRDRSDCTKISSILECVNYMALQTSTAKRRDIVMIFGKSNSGKTCLANFMSGCHLERVSPKDHKLNTNSTEPIIRVSKDSLVPETLKIDHVKSPMTNLCKACSDPISELSMYECSGLTNSSVFEINISNYINMKSVTFSSKSIRVAYMLNYDSLVKDPKTEVLDLKKCLQRVFGGTRNFLKYRKSLIILVNKIPDSVTVGGVRELILGADDGCISELEHRIRSFNMVDGKHSSESFRKELRYILKRKVYPIPGVFVIDLPMNELEDLEKGVEELCRLSNNENMDFGEIVEEVNLLTHLVVADFGIVRQNLKLGQKKVVEYFEKLEKAHQEDLRDNKLQNLSDLKLKAINSYKLLDEQVKRLISIDWTKKKRWGRGRSVWEKTSGVEVNVDGSEYDYGLMGYGESLILSNGNNQEENGDSPKGQGVMKYLAEGLGLNKKKKSEKLETPMPKKEDGIAILGRLSESEFWQSMNRGSKKSPEMPRIELFGTAKAPVSESEN
jgi:hypothetical protein